MELGQEAKKIFAEYKKSMGGIAPNIILDSLESDIVKLITKVSDALDRAEERSFADGEYPLHVPSAIAHEDGYRQCARHLKQELCTE